MQSRFFVNILLLVIVIILVIAVYFSDNNDPGIAEKLTTIDPNSITSVSIQHKDRILTLKKSGQRWSLTEPVNIAANDFRIASVIKILQTPSYASYEINELSLDNVGLENPKTTLTLNSTRIDFGIANPISNYRYIKFENKIHLIDDLFYPLLSSQTGTLVSFSPLPRGSKIIKLALPQYIMELNLQGLWRSNKELSADAIVETVKNWENAQAFGVHNYLKRDSLGSIKVYLKNIENPVVFEITDTDPWLIIARPELDIEYHFNIELYDSLLRPGAPEQSPEQPPEELVEQ